MARARNIKPGFFKNEVLAEMPMEIRMLFIGLWTLADREGRLEDRPKRIKMELFAYDSFDVDPMLNRLQDDGFLTRYGVNSTRFIQIANFVKHQDPHYKEKASEIPPPPGVENIIKATAITRSQRAVILERDGHACRACRATEHLCIDHVIPVSRGGDSSDDNLQVLCHSCNTKKGNKLDGEERGVKKSKHNPDATVVRFNVGPNSNQRNTASPSDSLIPDSLIPDSLIPDSLIPDSGYRIADTAAPAAKRGQAAQSRFAALDYLLDKGVDRQIADDWLKVRKLKRAAATQTALDAVMRQIEKSGMTANAALQLCCEKGWAAFDPDWLTDRRRSNQSNSPQRRQEDIDAQAKAANEEARRLLFGDRREVINA